MQRPESFERFYMTKVGLGEGCGCAERVIDVHEFNRKRGQAVRRGLPRLTPPVSWRGFLRKYGLARRPE